MSADSFQVLTSGQASSAISLVICGIVSFVAVVCILSRVLWVATQSALSGSEDRRRTKVWLFFSTPLGWYTASLLVANALTCVHGILEVAWVSEKRITTGSTTCTAQAAFEQVGNFATSYFTVCIAVHAFNGLVRRKRFPLWACTLYMVAGWTSSIITGVIVPRLSRPRLGMVYGSDGYACSIATEYTLHEFLFQLLPVIATALLSAVLYAVMFLVLRGTVQVRNGISFNLNPDYRWTGVGNDSVEYQRFIGAIVRSMILYVDHPNSNASTYMLLRYPFAYTLLLMPLTLTRLVALSKGPVPFGAGIFAGSCRLLLGLVNSLIVFKILRILRPAIGSSVQSNKSEESFQAPELKPSPVEPTAAAAPTRAFPPPRKSEERRPAPSIRSQPSFASLSELGHPLLPQRPYMHAHTRSSSSGISSMTAVSLSRPITPVSELNKAIATPQRMPRPEAPVLRVDPSSATNGLGHFVRRGSAESLGLPPPPRHSRPSVPHKSSSLPSLETIPATPAVDNDSGGDPVIPSDHLGPPQWTAGYSGTSSDSSSAVQQPAFLDLSSRPSVTAVTPVPAVTGRHRSAYGSQSQSSEGGVDAEDGSADSVDSQGRLPSLAWATLVANAATQDVVGMAMSSFSSRAPSPYRGQRDVPLDIDAPVPVSLQPGTPSSANPVFRLPSFAQSTRTRKASTDSSIGYRALTPEPKINAGLRESHEATRQDSIASRIASPAYR
ncbi:hypothetical protein OE88DRAFT_1736558 [Heliocybe sulcata]|uniref:Glucose receptor Git3 N-terminal domain-containing protein n=1 Tax=Heliocybe sulcata TaxID=5364 RepID=A0A5C3MX04_9AGAM|nr:hypothetical protein OE88DRAFT_1736558 [Heliocybe sulcata]